MKMLKPAMILFRNDKCGIKIGRNKKNIRDLFSLSMAEYPLRYN
jgi:hypothetical protein